MDLATATFIVMLIGLVLTTTFAMLGLIVQIIVAIKK